MQFAESQGLYQDVKETSNMALQSTNNDNVYFIPRFSSFKSSTSFFVGRNESTSKNILVRAVLESIVYSIAEAILLIKTEDNLKLIRIDGGISNNDFICQMLADLCEIYIERSTSAELTSYGVAYLCAIKEGILKDLKEIEKLYQHERIFAPRREHTNTLRQQMEFWQSLKVTSINNNFIQINEE